MVSFKIVQIVMAHIQLTLCFTNKLLVLFQNSPFDRSLSVRWRIRPTPDCQITASAPVGGGLPTHRRSTAGAHVAPPPQGNPPRLLLFLLPTTNPATLAASSRSASAQAPKDFPFGAAPPSRGCRWLVLLLLFFQDRTASTRSQASDREAARGRRADALG
jgi:hypothetical protein